MGFPLYEVGTPAVDRPSLLRPIEKLVHTTRSSWVTTRKVIDRLTGPFSFVLCLGMWVPAGQAIGESCGKGSIVHPRPVAVGTGLLLLGGDHECDLGLGCARGFTPTFPTLLLQVAMAHLLRAEEPRPRLHPSPPTLYPHRLEASHHHRASHRAMVPHHSSVSAVPSKQTQHVNCHPFRAG